MLKLTKKADYSLIALKHFAAGQKQSGSAVSAKEVADAYGIPLPLLSKLLQKLGKAGFLISEQGTNGGYRLAKDATEISALDVIRVIDGPMILTSCLTDHPNCDHLARCSVKRPLERLHESILRLLDSVTIEDMLRDSEQEAGHLISGSLVALTGAPNPSPFQTLRK